MPAPRKPSTEEQLARTANAKRIGPSTKTIASLRIMKSIHLPTVKDLRAECHRRIKQYTWPERGRRNPEPRPGDTTTVGGSGWGQQRCLSFLVANPNRDGVGGDPPEGQHMMKKQRGQHSPAPAARDAPVAAEDAPAAEEDVAVIEPTKPPSVRFDNKNVVARACHCLLETRDELVEVDRDLSRAEKNPGVDKPADVWAEKFCEIFNDITEVFQVPCLDTILEGYDPETEPLGPGIRIGAAHAMAYLRSMRASYTKAIKDYQREHRSGSGLFAQTTEEAIAEADASLPSGGASGSEADERQGKTFYEVCFEKGHSTAYYLYCLFAGDTDIFNVLSEAMPEGCCSNSTQGSKDPTKQQVKRSSKKRKHNESDGSGGNTTVAVQMRESDSLADSICYMQVLKRCVMFHVNL